jgi:hypothetical protein
MSHPPEPSGALFRVVYTPECDRDRYRIHYRNTAGAWRNLASASSVEDAERQIRDYTRGRIYYNASGDRIE